MNDISHPIPLTHTPLILIPPNSSSLFFCFFPQSLAGPTTLFVRIMSNENADPLFKKQEKHIFLSSMVSLLTCHGIFYLLCSVMFPWAWGYSQCRPSQMRGAPSYDLPDSSVPESRTLGVEGGAVTGQMGEPAVKDLFRGGGEMVKDGTMCDSRLQAPSTCPFSHYL